MDEASIFLEALQRPKPAERAAYLDQACAGNNALRQDVEMLLKAHAQAGEFLNQPAANPVVTVDAPIQERPGTIIGPYKLLVPGTLTVNKATPSYSNLSAPTTTYGSTALDTVGVIRYVGTGATDVPSGSAVITITPAGQTTALATKTVGINSSTGAHGGGGPAAWGQCARGPQQRGERPRPNRVKQHEHPQQQQSLICCRSGFRQPRSAAA